VGSHGLFTGSAGMSTAAVIGLPAPASLVEGRAEEGLSAGSDEWHLIERPCVRSTNFGRLVSCATRKDRSRKNGGRGQAHGARRLAVARGYVKRQEPRSRNIVRKSADGQLRKFRRRLYRLLEHQARRVECCPSRWSVGGDETWPDLPGQYDRGRVPTRTELGSVRASAADSLGPFARCHQPNGPGARPSWRATAWSSYRVIPARANQPEGKRPVSITRTPRRLAA